LAEQTWSKVSFSSSSSFVSHRFGWWPKNNIQRWSKFLPCQWIYFGKGSIRIMIRALKCKFCLGALLKVQSISHKFFHNNKKGWTRATDLGYCRFGNSWSCSSKIWLSWQ
jgi:hypothetical protein